jgi:tetratricopeptide (TPR) repeat protein
VSARTVRAIRLARAASLAMLVAGAGGCGDSATYARRYKAERLISLAQRTETQVRLTREHPDSVTLLRLREPFLRVAREVPPPYVRGSSVHSKQLGHEVLRIVGTAELQAARLAVEAKRSDLALDAMRRVAVMAGQDTIVRRRADFFLVATLRQERRFEEAIALMRDMLRRYRPMAPDRPGDEDAVLAIPEGIVGLKRDMGDTEGAKAALAEAARYYQGLLRRRYPPILEAQIRARFVRVELEQQQWALGMRELEILRRLASTSRELGPLEPEIRYSEAKLFAALNSDKDPVEAVDRLDRVAKDFPQSPFAPRAVLEAGALLERRGQKKAALDRYRQAAEMAPRQLDVAPVATFRRALLEDQVGNWELAKNLLESIPVLYPESQAAVEAPMSIAQHYVRAGQRDAAVQAVQRAIGTYRDLVARDSTSKAGPLYRWSIFRCYRILNDGRGALEAADEMVARDLGNPFTAQVLLESAQIAHQSRQDERARAYLERFLAAYPNSPMAADVRHQLALIAGAGRR